jgi:hypothetical protein
MAFDRRPLVTTFADKLAARDYVEEIEAALAGGYEEVAIYAPGTNAVAVWVVLNSDAVVPVKTLTESCERWSRSPRPTR